MIGSRQTDLTIRYVLESVDKTAGAVQADRRVRASAKQTAAEVRSSQAQQVAALRATGKSYKEISALMGLSASKARTLAKEYGVLAGSETRAGTATRRLTSETRSLAASQRSAQASGRGLANTTSAIRSEVSALGGAVRVLAGYGIARLFAGAARSGFEFQTTMESNKLALTRFLGSAKEADAFLARMFETAKNTPFEFTDLASASRRLLAFGLDAETTERSLAAVGDAVAAMGGGAENIDRVTLALGQIQARGKASGEELLQLAEAGIPAMKILQKELGLTGEEVSNISDQNIDAATAIEALTKGMEREFAGASAAFAKTMGGQISTLHDDWAQFTGALTADLFEATKKWTPAVDAALQDMTRLFQRDDLSLEEKLSLSRQVVAFRLKPVIDEIEVQFQRARVGERLAQAIGEGIPIMARIAGGAGGKIAVEFVKGWAGADLGAKLATLALLGFKFGLFGALARRAAGQFSRGFGGARVGQGIGSQVFGGIGQRVGTLRNRFGRTGQQVGTSLGGGISTSAANTVATDLPKRVQGGRFSSGLKRAGAIGGVALGGAVLSSALEALDEDGKSFQNKAADVLNRLTLGILPEGLTKVDELFEDLTGSAARRGLAGPLGSKAGRSLQSFKLDILDAKTLKDTGALKRIIGDLDGVLRGLPSNPIFKSLRPFEQQKALQEINATLHDSEGALSRYGGKADKTFVATRGFVRKYGDESKKAFFSLEDAAELSSRGLENAVLKHAKGAQGKGSALFQRLRKTGTISFQGLDKTAGDAIASIDNRVGTGLKALGAKPVSLVIANGSVSAGTKAGLAMGGGFVPGSGLQDTVPFAPGYVAAPSEFYLVGNRHTQQRIDGMLAPYGTSVANEIAGESRKHSEPVRMASGGIVGLGRQLQSQGYEVSEHPAFGGVGQHAPNSLHYSANAIDINDDDAPGGESASLSRLNARLREQGWHTLWQVPDHFDHLHIDTGSGIGGVVGGLSKALAEIKRIVIGGPDGAMKSIAQGAADKVRDAANSYLSRQGGDVGSFMGGSKSAGGSYDKGRLAKLWESVGGVSGSANLAAAIALAESGGNPNATNSNTDGSTDRGLWQINSIHGGLSTFDPIANAKAARQISGNGSNWSPWVAYTNGRYQQYLAEGGFAGWFGAGGSGIVDRPTLFGAGESGPEHVQITPLAKGGRVGKALRSASGSVDDSKVRKIEGKQRQNAKELESLNKELAEAKEKDSPTIQKDIDKRTKESTKLAKELQKAQKELSKATAAFNEQVEKLDLADARKVETALTRRRKRAKGNARKSFDRFIGLTGGRVDRVLAGASTRSAADVGLANTGLDQLELQQRLAGTFETGGKDRASFIQSRVIPALQRQFAALQAELKEAQRDKKPGRIRELRDSSATLQSDILAAQVAAKEATEANTDAVDAQTDALRELTGSLGFEYQGQRFTDDLMLGV